MNTVPQPAVPVGGFISVDDGGEFDFHESAGAVVAAFEYPGEAACILDRQGVPFRLAPRPDGRLALVQDVGITDFAWLGNAWGEAQRRGPHRYPLRRFHPPDSRALLETLFECLWLRHGPEPWPPPSAVAAGAILVDPFGHAYRAVEVPSLLKSARALAAQASALRATAVHVKPGAGIRTRHPVFVEIEAVSGTRRGCCGGPGQDTVSGRPTVTGMPAPGVAGS
ncbi:hypothetical protein B5P43_13990 [Bacillus sp. SRB_336]|nr:hypothetical protein B5P43_13990 [Bacillus sp. SRB_336]